MRRDISLDRIDRPLDRIETLFFTLTRSRNTPAVQKLAGVVRPKMSKVQDTIFFNKELFARIALELVDEPTEVEAGA